MKWLLLGFGALMVVVGGSCVISGYPIVEVERGWALVISGATVLSGGAIVFALGLALARIESIVRTLALGMRTQTAALASVAPVARPSAPEAPPAAPQGLAGRGTHLAEGPRSGPLPGEALVQGEALAASGGPTGPAAPPVRARVWKSPAFLGRQPPSEIALDATVAALAAPVQAPPRFDKHGEGSESASEITTEGPPNAQEPPVGESPPAQAEPAGAPELEPSISLSNAVAPVEPQPAPEPELAPEPGPSVRRFPLRSLTLPRGAWPDPPIPSTGEAGQAAAQEEPPVTQQEEAPVAQEDKNPDEATAEDWFERALANLDETQAQEAPAPQETPAPHVAAHAESTDQRSGSPTVSEPATETESGKVLSSDSPTIIGRYETEGTIYVMYSDGSIEAETTGGVYRFESLAALKAHIERPT